jgi:thiol:disulfide interchange protein DsbC
MKTMKLLPTLLAAAALSTSLGASAQDAAIRKTLGERIPQLQQIDEVRPTPMKGLYEDRINKLTAVDFKALPLQDAFTVVRGDGSRKLAVFEDPNCGYCKRFEKDMQNVDNVTVYMFLYPILSPDSAEKSRNIWCAKDRVAAWDDHMLRDKVPAAASCDTSALQRNLAFGRKHKITGTPTLIFSDGSRVPGAIGAQEVERRLTEVASSK